MHKPIRIAAQIHPQHGDYPAMRAAVVRAEELGYDIAYTWDHFYPLYGSDDDRHLECWTLLAAWAEATSRLELGPLVACNSYRNPNLLADMARTVDRISRGRVILGLGAGWKRRDYEEYGYEFGTRASRIEALGEAIPVIRRRLEVLEPPPLRRMPILIGGTGPRRTLRLVALYADGWHAMFPDRPEELEPTVRALLDWCAEFGRDPSSIEWGVGVEPEDLDGFFAKDAETYLAMGFTQFTLGFNGPDFTVDAGRSALAWRDEQNRHRGLSDARLAAVEYSQRQAGRAGRVGPGGETGCRAPAPQDQPADCSDCRQHDEGSDRQHQTLTLEESDGRRADQEAEQEVATDEQAVANHQATQEGPQRQTGQAAGSDRRHAHAGCGAGDSNAACAAAAQLVRQRFDARL
jgi:probable F420-dependent oxidoreductase